MTPVSYRTPLPRDAGYPQLAAAPAETADLVVGLAVAELIAALGVPPAAQPEAVARVLDRSLLLLGARFRGGDGRWLYAATPHGSPETLLGALPDGRTALAAFTGEPALHAAAAARGGTADNGWDYWIGVPQSGGQLRRRSLEQLSGGLVVDPCGPGPVVALEPHLLTWGMARLVDGSPS